MNERLLTGNEIGKPTTKEEKSLYASISEMELGRQDAKTLKAVEKVIRASILTDDGWVYTIPASFVEALRKGKL